MPHFTRPLLDPTLAVVEAVQWFPGDTVAGVADESPGHAGGMSLLAVPPHAFLTNGRQRLTVFASDWVVTEESGRQHICQDSLFTQNYVLVDAEQVAPQLTAR